MFRLGPQGEARPVDVLDDVVDISAGQEGKLPSSAPRGRWPVSVSA
jgi:hypothetical protein